MTRLAVAGRALARSPVGRPISDSHDDRAFARALGWSVGGHLVLALVLAPLVASSASAPIARMTKDDTEVTYEFALVHQAAEAVDRALPMPVTALFAEPAPTAPQLEMSAASPHSHTAAPVSPGAMAARVDASAPAPQRHESLEAPPVERPPGPVAGAMATEREPAQSAPVLLVASSSAPMPGVGFAEEPSPRSPSSSTTEGSRSLTEGARVGAPGAPRVGDPPASSSRGAAVAPSAPSASGGSSGAVSVGTGSSSVGENLLAAYRGRVVAWLQPRVERRFAADPEGRALDAASLAVVRLQVTIDAGGRATVSELASPSPALERILRDVIAAGGLPRPPTGLAAPVTLRLRIRFSLV